MVPSVYLTTATAPKRIHATLHLPATTACLSATPRAPLPYHRRYPHIRCSLLHLPSYPAYHGAAYIPYLLPLNHHAFVAAVHAYLIQLPPTAAYHRLAPRTLRCAARGMPRLPLAHAAFFAPLTRTCRCGDVLFLLDVCVRKRTCTARTGVARWYAVDIVNISGAYRWTCGMVWLEQAVAYNAYRYACRRRLPANLFSPTLPVTPSLPYSRVCMTHQLDTTPRFSSPAYYATCRAPALHCHLPHLPMPPATSPRLTCLPPACCLPRLPASPTACLTACLPLPLTLSTILLLPRTDKTATRAGTRTRVARCQQLSTAPPTTYLNASSACHSISTSHFSHAAARA